MTYWYHDGDDRHECETQEAARAGAQGVLDDATNECQWSGKWGEAVEFVGWGRVVDGKDEAVEWATRVNVVEMCHEPRGCGCGKLHGASDDDDPNHEDANENYNSGVDYLCEYELLPVEVTQ